MEIVSNSIRSQEKIAQEQAPKFEQSLQLCEKATGDQVKAMEKSFQSQTAPMLMQ